METDKGQHSGAWSIPHITSGSNPQAYTHRIYTCSLCPWPTIIANPSRIITTRNTHSHISSSVYTHLNGLNTSDSAFIPIPIHAPSHTRTPTRHTGVVCQPPRLRGTDLLFPKHGHNVLFHGQSSRGCQHQLTLAVGMEQWM